MDEIDSPVDEEMPLVEDCNNKNVEANFKLCSVNNLQLFQFPESRYENRAGTFTTGIDIFSKEVQLKMEERAKRFGLADKLKNSMSNHEQDLYASMGIGEDNENTRNIRLNVIHMRGTEDMSTKDVFKYFEDYAPASIEWINDISCNVVWLDTVSAARAMLGLSKRITGLSEKSQSDKSSKLDEGISDVENNVTSDESITNDHVENLSATETIEKEGENEINIKDIDYPLPPGLWRKGIYYPKSRGIFLRFATRADKKQPKAEKMSEYYKKYGNPNFGGIKGILTESRKRMYKQIKQNKKKLIEEPQEPNTINKNVKNPWGALSESWGVHDFVENEFNARNDYKDQKRNIKGRLGHKAQSTIEKIEEQSDSSSSSDSEDAWCKRSKVLRMRMHADDEEEKIHKRRSKLQNKITSNDIRSSRDLRSRLGKQTQSIQFRDAIQVIVTNVNAAKPNLSKNNDSEEEDGEIIEDMQTDLKEEGEWQDSNEEIEDEKEEEEEQGNDSEDSDMSTKEIQGPKGSVIKVVQHKPRVASTVWTRLNNVKSVVNNNALKERQSRNRDLRDTLKSGDLRSRIRHHTRGRSPLRIEVKNDKYTEDGSSAE